MAPFSPALDQPYTFDYADLAVNDRFAHANTAVSFESDRDSDLYGLEWAWSRHVHVTSVRVRLSIPQGDALTPLVTRIYPGYQETIFGSDGVIISKRQFAPRQSGYDQAALWLLECQAEGDWLVRMEVDIDWGMPLIQRIVDGLLVAQVNPGPEQGVYGQQNAESTRIFGTTQGRPDHVEFVAESRARLVYHLLITGTVEIPLLMILSDVGEQLAWNAFLALRDIGHIFATSQRGWHRIVHTGRLWTPSPRLNYGVQLGKIAAMQQLRRLRTGLAPADRMTRSVPPLLQVLDGLDMEYSRELLAHLQKLARRSRGKIPVMLPDQPKARPAAPDVSIAETNAGYLHAVAQHLQRHPDLDFLADHYPTVVLCAETLVKARWGKLQQADGATLRQVGAALRRGVALARLQNDSANLARWESEAAEYVRLGSDNSLIQEELVSVDAHGERNWTAACPEPLPQILVTGPQAVMDLSARAVWRGCGVSWSNGTLYVRPDWPVPWRWWALLDLPIAGRIISLFWDGQTLYTTQPVAFAGPTRLCTHLRAQDTDPDAFHLGFAVEQEGSTSIFRPTFD